MLSTEPTKHHSPRSMHSKRPRKKKIHPHIEYLQEQIDTLKAELVNKYKIDNNDEVL
jgi:hypothetical protein